MKILHSVRVDLAKQLVKKCTVAPCYAGSVQLATHGGCDARGHHGITKKPDSQLLAAAAAAAAAAMGAIAFRAVRRDRGRLTPALEV